MRLKITGTLTPDATTVDTGEPVGIHNNLPYWSWVNGGVTYYLWAYVFGQWQIGPVIFASPKWKTALFHGDSPIGTYLANGDGVGVAEVAEYVAPPAASLTVIGGMVHVHGAETTVVFGGTVVMG